MARRSRWPSLGRRGIDVHFLGNRDAPESHSRHIRSVRLLDQGGEGTAWAGFLLGPDSEALWGAVLLACEDAGIEFLITHRAELARRYLLDISNPVAQESFLNKLSTYRSAEAAGVPTPRFWEAETLDQVRAHQGEYAYPLMIKPLFSHRFVKVFDRKFLVARTSSSWSTRAAKPFGGNSKSLCLS